MGSWHQDIVIKGVSDEELDEVANQIIQYLIRVKIISVKKGDNILGKEFGYCPGEYWDFVVQYPEEEHFLDLKTNGMEVRKGRTVFWADGRDFEKIECPSCSQNNLECDWGDLFSLWMKDPKEATYQCKKCKQAISISDYIFEPKWALSNLGFTFWNWPMFKNEFILTLEKKFNKKIILVEGKL